jgi:hypothetical protein
MRSSPKPEAGSFAARVRGLGLRCPADIQAFVNSLPYNDRIECKSPLRVLGEGTAHCAEGAYFAAAALRALFGLPPLVVDLAAEEDDDHLLAVYTEGGLWGAVAKSNTTLLRGRAPVYRSVRELVMSYYDMYFNVLGTMSLRGYSRPADLSRFDRRGWTGTDDDLEYIGDFLTASRHYPVASPGFPHAAADPDLVEACFLKAKASGLYRPPGGPGKP